MEIKDAEKMLVRMAEIKEWLKVNGENCVVDQKHLDEGSQERIYWHFGYASALADMVMLLSAVDQRLKN